MGKGRRNNAGASNHHGGDDDGDTHHVTFFQGSGAADSHSPLHNHFEARNNNEQQQRKKPEELKPFPAKEYLPGLDFCVTTPPAWRLAILLAFQHYVLSLGAIVLIPSILVPQMGGGYHEKATVIQSLLLVSGFNTLLQTLFGSRLPTVVVASYNYIIPVLSIIHADRYKEIQNPHERFETTMRGIQGALIVSACIQSFVGFVGMWRIPATLLSPLSAVPLVAFSGLGFYYLGFPLIASCAEYGVPAIFLMVFISQLLPWLAKSGRQIFGRFAVLHVACLIWILAMILTASGVYEKTEVSQLTCRTDSAGIISGVLWAHIPYPFQWGAPTFNAGDCVSMTVASLVTLVEGSGGMIATARFGGATPIPSSVFGRGAACLGIGSLLNAFFGTTVGSAISVENAGLTGLTKAGSRRVIQISAFCMILFSLSGKFGAVVASIPLPALAAANVICYAYVVGAGLSHLQFCNLNSFRNMFILGFSIVIGVSVPHYFSKYSDPIGAVHTKSSWYWDTFLVIFTSQATLGTLVAVVLDRILGIKDADSRKESGMPWWDKYLVYNKDPSSHENYSLPLSLDKHFPAV